MTVEVRAVSECSSTMLANIRDAVAFQRTLSDVVRWLSTMDSENVLCDVVAQDEYTHDVTVHYEGAYLVYDVT